MIGEAARREKKLLLCDWWRFRLSLFYMNCCVVPGVLPKNYTFACGFRWFKMAPGAGPFIGGKLRQGTPSGGILPFPKINQIEDIETIRGMYEQNRKKKKKKKHI